MAWRNGEINMALKDYTRDGNKFISKKYIIGVIYPYENYEDIWRVSVWNRNSSKIVVDKKFDSGISAHGFVVDYMKKH